MTAAAPRTARDLFAAVAPYGPAADGEELAFAAAPPADLGPLLGVLHTGVRALAAGRMWYGLDPDTGRAVELRPAAPIPAGVGLVAVEGDSRWDRIPADAHLDRPRLFAAAADRAR